MPETATEAAAKRASETATEAAPDAAFDPASEAPTLEQRRLAARRYLFACCPLLLPWVWRARKDPASFLADHAKVASMLGLLLLLISGIHGSLHLALVAVDALQAWVTAAFGPAAAPPRWQRMAVYWLEVLNLLVWLPEFLGVLLYTIARALGASRGRVATRPTTGRFGLNRRSAPARARR
ncbi:MAG: hypothetical protein H6729_02295 [Deltaproteobacteria bacterium]|nr:hypothetical protein [Deltaproteobacteria bacterium]